MMDVINVSKGVTVTEFNRGAPITKTGGQIG